MPDVQIHHKYQKEICKRFLFRRIHHDIAFPIEWGGRIFWSYVYPRQFELLCESGVVWTVSHTLAQGVQHVPVSKINIYTVIRCDTLASAVVVLGGDGQCREQSFSVWMLRQKININVNARAPSKMCQSEFSYHNKVNNRTAVPRSHLLWRRGSIFRTNFVAAVGDKQTMELLFVIFVSRHHHRYFPGNICHKVCWCCISKTKHSPPFASTAPPLAI